MSLKRKIFLNKTNNQLMVTLPKNKLKELLKGKKPKFLNIKAEDIEF
jgi:hypothetical protein